MGSRQRKVKKKISERQGLLVQGKQRGKDVFFKRTQGLSSN